MKMNRTVWIVLILIVVVAGVAFLFMQPSDTFPTASNFEECVALGNPVMESYPRQCRTPNGDLFVEDIGNELEKQDLIRIDAPRPNETVGSPLTIRGEARGYWFFEASFPIRIYDGNNTELGVAVAQAQDEWMTENFVPFEAVLTFTAPVTAVGRLVLQKDNPSGLPENDDALIMPIKFNANGSPISAMQCRPTGCSSQICADHDVATTCEYKPEYACYAGAVCERQISGECGWTETPALTACLQASL